MWHISLLLQIYNMAFCFGRKLCFFLSFTTTYSCLWMWYTWMLVPEHDYSSRRNTKKSFIEEQQLSQEVSKTLMKKNVSPVLKTETPNSHAIFYNWRRWGSYAEDLIGNIRTNLRRDISKKEKMNENWELWITYFIFKVLNTAREKTKVLLGEENIMDIHKHNLNKSLLSWKMKE